MFKSLALMFATVTVAAAAPAQQAENKEASTERNMAPTDPQIAMIAVVADNVDIDAGKLAAEKAHDKKVKDFAELMVRDHTSVNDKANALVKKLGVTPEESATSTSLKSGGEKTIAKLKALNGTQFDKAYINNEITYHTNVLGVFDKTLIPNAKNKELKSLLESARPIVASHLEHARTLQASMQK